MNWHNQLENFASRGLKEQQAVDEVLRRSTESPLPGSAGGATNAAGGVNAQVTPGAGLSDKQGPAPGGSGRSGSIATGKPALEKGTIQDSVDLLARVATSTDQAWLQSVMRDQDQPVTVRNAAQRRLRILRRGV